MLEQYKQLYRDNIKNKELENWDKNKLLIEYVATNDEQYLSAAIYKFWYILNSKISKNTNNKFIEKEDFYEMYIDSILDTCNNRLWEKKDHILYQDKKAPEKSINTIFNSKIINYFYSCNRQKRKSSFEKKSLQEDWDIALLLNNRNSYISQKHKDINKLIVDLFNKKDYYSSYILDIIVNNDPFDVVNDKLIFNKKKLKHYLMTLDTDYYKYFSTYYNINIDKVLYSIKYIENMQYEYIDKKINKSLKSLFNNDELIKILYED